MTVPAMSAAAGRDKPPARKNADIGIALVTSLDDFAAMRGEWDALFERSALPQQVFQSFTFLWHWARHYLDAKSALSIVIGRMDGRLVMVWPLVRRRWLGLDTLRFMGVPVAQFGDVLVDGDQDAAILLRAGWDAVIGLNADFLEARKVRADSVFAAVGFRGEGILLDSARAPFAELHNRVGTDGPGSAYSARERSNYRRRVRRLAEHGAVVFREYGPGAEAGACADAAVAMKKKWLDHHAIVSPTIADPRFTAFFNDLALDADGGSPLRVSTIECDGRPVGIDLSLDCKGHAFGHVIATDLSFEREGVGRVLVHQVFANARRRGNRIFDLLTPADLYKMQHADGMVCVEDIAFPFTLRGRLMCDVGLKRVLPVVKSLAKRLPAGIVGRLF